MTKSKVAPESPEIERAFELLMEERDPPSILRAPASAAEAKAHKERQEQRRAELADASKPAARVSQPTGVTPSPISNASVGATDFSRAFDILIPGHALNVDVVAPAVEIVAETESFSTTPG